MNGKGMRLYTAYIRCKYVGAGLIAVVLIGLLPVSGLCQARYTEAQFLLIVPDARGKSLGDGGSVFSRGAISAYYNPALLVTGGEFSGEFNYCKYLPELTDEFSIKNIFLSHRLKDLGFLGFGYTRFDYGEISGTGDSYDYALGLWAALAFDINNSVGLGVKYIKRKDEYIDYWSATRTYEASSYAFDFGFLFRKLLPETTWRNDKINYPGLCRLFKTDRNKGFSFGLSVANLGKDMAFFDEDNPDPLPKRLRLGVGYQAVDSEPMGLRLTVDATKLLIYMDDPFKEEWSEIVWSYGLEATFYYILHFRLGRLLDRDGHQRLNTIGFGIGSDWLGLDYSLVPGDLGDWNRRAGEYSISFKCNISSDIFERF